MQSSDQTHHEEDCSVCCDVGDSGMVAGSGGLMMHSRMIWLGQEFVTQLMSADQQCLSEQDLKFLNKINYCQEIDCKKSIV